jgi:hypothetical protein
MTIVYEQFIKQVPWVYAKIKITFKHSHIKLEDMLTFRNLIFLASKHAFGITGQAIHVDVIDYEPQELTGLIRVPSE